MRRLLRWLMCRLGQHDGHVDGGFRCDYCRFEVPYDEEAGLRLADAAIRAVIPSEPLR